MNIKYNNKIEERFIPIQYTKLCIDTLDYLNSNDIADYVKFANLLSKYYYEKSYDDLEILKNNYLPFSPDNELVSHKFNNEKCDSIESELFTKIDDILNDANYEVLTKEMLEIAINKTSPYGVEVSINFDDFDEMRIYFRGQAIQKENILDPFKLYMKRKTISVPIYRRLVLMIKPKQFNSRAKEIALKENISIEKAKKKLSKNEILRKDENNRNIYIKLFKNIPQIDLEMLFPNTKIKMRLFDKFKIAVVGGGGTISGVFTLFAKLGSIVVEPMSALVALGAFAGVLWRQIKGVLYRRNHYLAKLAQKLYFYNISNNSSALIYLIDNANDEQSKEALLAYLFLSHEKSTITKEQLDKKIEAFIFKKYNIKVDFEIDDGLKKLKELGVLIDSDKNLSVLKLPTVFKILSKLNYNFT